MKIGVFDSGLGGLNVLRTIRDHLPDYDYIYLGDTLHVPYGKRAAETIIDLTRNAIEFLFKQDCQIVIVACNTASAAALRHLQQTYLPHAYPERRILGVIVPMLEAASESGCTNIGVIGTDYIAQSGVYEDELRKINPATNLTVEATPLLVPLLEACEYRWLPVILKDYLAPIVATSPDALILGCTHYALLKPYLPDILDVNTRVFSQDDLVPPKLADYLNRHPEHEIKLSRGQSCHYFITDCAQTYQNSAKAIWGETIPFEKAIL